MKMLFDFLPIALFFIAYKFWGIYVATGVAHCLQGRSGRSKDFLAGHIGCDRRFSNATRIDEPCFHWMADTEIETVEEEKPSS